MNSLAARILSEIATAFLIVFITDDPRMPLWQRLTVSAFRLALLVVLFVCAAAILHGLLGLRTWAAA